MTNLNSQSLTLAVRRMREFSRFATATVEMSLRWAHDLEVSILRQKMGLPLNERYKGGYAKKILSSQVAKNPFAMLAARELLDIVEPESIEVCEGKQQEGAEDRAYQDAGWRVYYELRRLRKKHGRVFVQRAIDWALSRLSADDKYRIALEGQLQAYDSPTRARRVQPTLSDSNIVTFPRDGA